MSTKYCTCVIHTTSRYNCATSNCNELLRYKIMNIFLFFHQIPTSNAWRGSSNHHKSHSPLFTRRRAAAKWTFQEYSSTVQHRFEFEHALSWIRTSSHPSLGPYCRPPNTHTKRWSWIINASLIKHHCMVCVCKGLARSFLPSSQSREIASVFLDGDLFFPYRTLHYYTSRSDRCAPAQFASIHDPWFVDFFFTISVSAIHAVMCDHSSWWVDSDEVLDWLVLRKVRTTRNNVSLGYQLQYSVVRGRWEDQCAMNAKY